MYEFDKDFQPKNCKSGHDFELWTQGILTALGFDAQLTGGNDNGVDIIATISTVKGKIYKFYIQCKFYNRPVGKTPVQEVYTGCQYFGGDGYLEQLLSDDATKALGGRFADDAILVTDENNAYNELAESEGIRLEQVLSTKHVKGPFNLARINSICDNLKNFLGPDRYRPSTKYLDLWLLFYIWLEKHKELNTYQK